MCLFVLWNLGFIGKSKLENQLKRNVCFVVSARMKERIVGSMKVGLLDGV